MLVETSEGQLVLPRTQNTGNLKVSLGFSRPCPVEFSVSLKMEIPQPVWPRCFQCLTTPTVFFLFSISGHNSSSCDHCPLSFCYTLLWRVRLCLGYCTEHSSWSFSFSSLNKLHSPWPLCTASAPAPALLWWPSAELTSTQHPAPEVAFQVLCRGKKPLSSTCCLLFC